MTNKKSFFDKLREIKDVLVEENRDLTSLTTLKLQSAGDLVTINSLEALETVISLFKKENQPWKMIGWGANQLLEPIEKFPLIKLQLPFDKSLLDNFLSEYTLPASVGLNVLTAAAIKHSLKGWEVFTGVPASLGGAVFMNAGTNLGEIGDLVKAVQILDPKEGLLWRNLSKNDFKYRKNIFLNNDQIITQVTLGHFGQDNKIPELIKNYLQKRKDTQPLTTKNCGCVFKNPTPLSPAGQLIDKTGLKNLTLKGLRVSPIHGNFIENVAGANAADFHQLCHVITQQIQLYWGYELEFEVKVTDDK
jgi:UDP-N-acetylmuramate dehydrogenase